MAAPAASVPTEPSYFAEYDEETDTEGEVNTAHSGIVIKLEPESDPEDSYQTSCHTAASSFVNSGDGEAKNSVTHSRQFKQNSFENGVSNTVYDFSVTVKQEEGGDDCSMAVFPVRMYRSEHYHSGEENNMLQGDIGAALPQGDDASDGGGGGGGVSLSRDGADRGILHSSVNAGRPVVSRRKLSSVARRLPAHSYRPRAKRKRASGQPQAPVSGTADRSPSLLLPAVPKEEKDEQTTVMHPENAPAQIPDKPLTRPGRRGRRRNEKPQIFVCAECGMTFRWPSRYKEHLRKHSGERPFICRECGDAFTSASYLRIHERKHSGQLPYPCTLCGQAFLHGRLLTEHRKVHAEEGAFACEDCGRKCGSPSELSRHLQALHPDNPSNRPFTCRLCPAAFQRSYHLETHMRSHTGEKPFKCELCGLSYTTQGSLKVHMRTHTGERPFACLHCDRAFITSGQLKKHSRTHNKPVVTLSTHNNTVYVQSLKSVATTTTNSAGGKDQGAGADGGGKTLKLEIQCFPRDSTYSCDICQEVFVRSIDLASHMRHDHPRPPRPRKENMCGECGQTFSRAHTLKVHLRSHAGVRPFKCETCGKRFTQRSNLNAHLRGHWQHKPFRCTVCGVSYSSAKYREQHMQTHGEIRPCECLVCGSTFSSNALLSAHMRSHDHSEVAAACAVTTALREPAPSPEATTSLPEQTPPSCDSQPCNVHPPNVRLEGASQDGAGSPEPEAEAGQNSTDSKPAVASASAKRARTSSKRQAKRGKKNNGNVMPRRRSVKVSAAAAATDSGGQMFPANCSVDGERDTMGGTEQHCESVGSSQQHSESIRMSEHQSSTGEDRKGSDADNSGQGGKDKSPEDQHEDDHYSSDTEPDS
ncbi:uncharacterized protein LOC143278115 [Babylonia areolata]|uniref:uncharacterized protein LOC143278115 n=1 Tax=Babylonia areolata TaxID=304850 RepID=UPI003FD3BC9A